MLTRNEAVWSGFFEWQAQGGAFELTSLDVAAGDIAHEHHSFPYDDEDAGVAAEARTQQPRFR